MKDSFLFLLGVMVFGWAICTYAVWHRPSNNDKRNKRLAIVGIVIWLAGFLSLFFL